MRLLLLALLTGCTPALTDGFGATLTDVGGCSDLVVYASNPEDTVLLRFDHDGAVAEALAAGEALTTTLVLPDPDTSLVVQVGEKIADAMCTDVIINGGPTVHEEWAATSGEATLTVRADGTDGWKSRADLTLTDVRFASEAGEEAALGDFAVTDISVGWLPG